MGAGSKEVLNEIANILIRRGFTSFHTNYTFAAPPLGAISADIGTFYKAIVG